MKNNVGLACLGLFSLVVVGIVVGAIMNGWALSVLWGWFVVPLFNVPPLSIPTAIGFALVVGLLTHQEQADNSKKKEMSDAIAALISRAVVSPLFTIFVGWIVKSFI